MLCLASSDLMCWGEVISRVWLMLLREESREELGGGRLCMEETGKRGVQILGCKMNK